MRPILWQVELPLLGEVTFPAYMTMLMVGFLIAIGMGRRQGDRIGVPGETIVDIGILMLVLGILGSRLLAVLTDGKLMDFVHLCTEPTLVEAIDSNVPFCDATQPCDYDYVCDLATNTCHPERDCLAALKFWQGGLTYYGGLLLALPGGLWFARRRGLDSWLVADLGAPLIMLGLFFGRLGCFFNGCCYGGATESFVGVRLPGHGDPVHPTQLYEGLAALAVFFLLYFVIRPRKRGHGEVFGWLLVVYGAIRFLLELFRADQRGALGPLSTSQIISIPLVALGVWLIVRVRRARRHRAAEPDDARGDARQDDREDARGDAREDDRADP